MEVQEFKDLLNRYHNGESTAEENAWLETWYMNFRTKDPVHLSEEEILTNQNQIWSRFAGHGGFSENRRRRLWPRIAAAASIILGVCVCLFYFNDHSRIVNPSFTNTMIKAGGNNAVLTLSDGSAIVLTTAANGKLARQSGVQITKTANGEIIYTAGPSTMDKAGGIGGALQNTPLLNTISTPRGGQYQLRLPDGSKVWLNAASKLIYPVSFQNQQQRKVELIGEAYFEIAKDKQHAFIVKSSGQEVQVIGTHFNINSYGDEGAVKTTLLEGSVKVTLNKETDHGAVEVILRPDQQSVLKGGALKISPVNTSEVIAWQKGYFEFHNESVYSIMRKVARWYDVDVVYENNLPKNGMTGTMSRYQEVGKVLDIMQSTGLVRFRIEGKTIYVCNN